MIWFLLAGGLAAALAMPALLSPWLPDKRRTLRVSLGLYLMALGIGFALGNAWYAIATGRVGISIKSVGDVASFSGQPVVASLVLLVNLACAGCFAALGWMTLRHPGVRDSQGPGQQEELHGFTAAERAAVEPEARRLLEARFPGLGGLQTPHFDSLLQVQIEELLHKQNR